MNGASRIRLLMIADTVGGVWTYAATLAGALARLNIDVHLVTMGPAARPDQRAMIADSRVRLIDSGLALEWQDPAGDDLPRARAVLRDIDASVRPDIIHLNSYREAAFDWTAPAVVVGHSCVNSWARGCHDGAWLWQQRWRSYTAAVGRGLDRAAAWVAPTRAFRDEIVRLYAPSTPGAVINNGITSAPAAEPDKQRMVLTAGRMNDAAKNLVVLAQAAAELPWPVCVVGETAVDGRSAANLVRLGALPHGEVLARMRRAGIFVSPALYEPFGLAVLEAASARCALVLSDIPTFRELWDGAARFVNPTDAGQLHRVLAELCADRQQRVRLQRAAKERAERYSLAAMAEAYAALYRLHATPGAAAEIGTWKVPA